MRYILPAFAAVAAAQAPNYMANAEAGMVALQRWYHADKGLWDNAQWWQQACALSTVAELGAIDPNFMANATAVFDSTFHRVPGHKKRETVRRRRDDGTMDIVDVPHGRGGDTLADFAALFSRADGPNWQRFNNDYFDDAGWWALAWIAGYDLTKKGEYLALAEAIFDNDLTKQGHPSRCGGGGIQWKKGDPYVNAIANELYLSIAAHLASRTADATKRAGYLQAAKDQWTWFKASGMINADNLINDGVNADCKNDGGQVYTYNQGVILGALVQLNLAEPATDNSYLTMANNIAQAAIAKLADPATHVLHDACEIPDVKACDKDKHQFKGIFMRNLLHLQQTTPNDTYATFIRANADSVQQHARFDEGTFTLNWAGPVGDPKTASTTSSAIDAIIAAAAIQPK